MRVKKLLLSLLFCAALLLPNSLQAKCAAPAFSMTAEQQSVLPNGELQVSFTLNGDLSEEIAALQFSLHYDSARLLYKGVVEGTVSDGELKIEQQGGDITGVYLDSAQDGKSISGRLLTLSFRVLAAAAPGPADFSAQIYDVSGWSEQMLIAPQNLSVQAQILPPPSNNALLVALEPSVGSLSPSFSAQNYEYTLNVPTATKSVLFSAQPQETDAYVRVDRKTIASGSLPTVITVTVTAPDGATKQDYRISVSREESAAATASSASSHSQTSAVSTQQDDATSAQTNPPFAQSTSSRSGNHVGGIITDSGMPGSTQTTGEAVQISVPAANQTGITRPTALVIKNSGFEAFLYGLLMAVLVGTAVFLVVYRSRVKEILQRVIKILNKGST